ncbi:MAG: AraC family transcriptional regulator [Acidobacteriota bacterium]|nr:AraC family transcriptional regulator [Acidobacteriota bacterium]
MESKDRRRPIFGKETRKLELADFTLVESLYPPSSRMPRHTHDLAHISIVLQGTYTEHYGHKHRSGEPSVLVLHPPDEDHLVTFHNAGARVFSIHLKPQWLERIRDYSKVLDSPADFRGGFPAWLAVRLYREFRELDKVSPLMIESLALEIIATISRHERLAEHKAPHWLAQVREMLHARLSEDVTVSSIAETVGVHPVYIARQFRKHYHCTMGEYVRRLRVEAACREISESDTPLSEIASLVGFYDQSHLTNTFKRLTGMAPAQYRRAFRSS